MQILHDIIGSIIMRKFKKNLIIIYTHLDNDIEGLNDTSFFTEMVNDITKITEPIFLKSNTTVTYTNSVKNYEWKYIYEKNYLKLRNTEYIPYYV